MHCSPHWKVRAAWTLGTWTNQTGIELVKRDCLYRAESKSTYRTHIRVRQLYNSKCIITIQGLYTFNIRVRLDIGAIIDDLQWQEVVEEMVGDTRGEIVAKDMVEGLPRDASTTLSIRRSEGLSECWTMITTHFVYQQLTNIFVLQYPIVWSRINCKSYLKPLIKCMF